MPNIDLSILNQRQTPAFYADVLANRPAAGFIGRIFVSTNTYEFYRDNGTGWDLIGGPGTGTVTGGGSLYRVGIWTSTSNIGESADLVFDYSQGHLGINTTTPGTALDVHHDQPTVAILNQTVATNDTRIGFQNNGVGLWRIGAFYNAGANDFGIYDAVAAIQPVTVKKTTGQVLIGTSTVGSGKLVVASATGDNGVQIVGASAPSLRIDNAETGPTKRAGLGISTATNNFIQGSADRDFCMFNGSTTASPILFGVYDAGAGNVQEAARISPSRNLLIGTTTDAGYKLQINGTARIQGDSIITTATNPTLSINSSGGGATQYGTLYLSNSSGSANGQLGQVSFGTTSGSVTASAIKSFVRAAGNVGDLSLWTGANAATQSFYLTATDFGGPSNTGGYGYIGNLLIANFTAGSVLANLRLTSNSTSVNTGSAMEIQGPAAGGTIVALGRFSAVKTTNNLATYTSDVFVSNGQNGSVVEGWRLFGSGNMGINANATDISSAVLFVNSTTKGFLPPRMTTAQKNSIATPATGLVIYDTTLNKLAVFTGVNWETVTSV